MMAYQINDEVYMETLPSAMYRTRYLRWKNDMLCKLDDMLNDLHTNGVDHMINTFGLTKKDIALLVRLNFIPGETAETYGLYDIERTVPS